MSESLQLASLLGQVSLFRLFRVRNLRPKPDFTTCSLLESGQSEHPTGRSTSPDTASPL
jgi:hypothetical protein